MTEFIFKYGSKKKPKKEIQNYDQWREAFVKCDSKGQIHWKDGRSAQCLAEDFMLANKQGRDMLIQLVEQTIGSEIIGKCEAYIEHGSRLDKFGGNARMQDLAVFGRLRNNQSFFIGLEAKVDETFNETIGKKASKIYNISKQKLSTNQPKRFMNLLNNFLHVEVVEDSFPELYNVSNEAKDLRYQLLYYLAGSFREEAEIIFMPVVVYQSNGQHFKFYNDKKAEQNKADYENFRNKLGFKAYKKIQFDGQDIEVYYAKIKDWRDNIEKDVYTCYVIR